MSPARNADEQTTPLLDPRNHIVRDVDTDRMKIFCGQNEWPSHVESIQDDLQTTRDQILQIQQQERQYQSKHTINSASCTSSDHKDWRFKICEWMFAISDHYGLHREVATVAMSFLDRTFHNPRIRRKLWSRIQKERINIHRVISSQKMSKPNSAMKSTHSSSWMLLVEENSTQLYRWVAVTSLFMAVKLVSPLRLHFREYCQLVPGKTLRPSDIFAMERLMLEVLDWQLHAPTAMSYVRLYLRFLFLEFSRSTTFNAYHERKACPFIDEVETERELRVAQAWRGMVLSCEALSGTAQYLTEVMAFLKTPWKKIAAESSHSTSVWAMAALWSALELFQAQDHADNGKREEEGNFSDVWRDLIRSHLLPSVDLKWDDVLQISRLFHPILFNQLPSHHPFVHANESVQTAAVLGEATETSSCVGALHIGGKTSPTSVLEDQERHLSEEQSNHEQNDQKVGHDAATKEIVTVGSTLHPSWNEATVLCSKREAMKRMVLKSKRQKRATTGVTPSAVGHKMTTSTKEDLSAPPVGKAMVAAFDRNRQPTAAIALSREGRLSRSHEPADCVGAQGISDGSSALLLHYGQSNGNKMLGSAHQMAECDRDATVVPKLRRPVPRRTTNSDDLLKISVAGGQKKFQPCAIQHNVEME